MNLHVVFSIVLKEPQNTVFSTRDSQAKMTRNWTRGDTCSWKGQLEKREVGKFKVEKSELEKFLFKLESLNLKNFFLSWKEPSEVGKNRA